MIVLTLNRQQRHRELTVVWEWNPYYRGRIGWWLWARLTPYVLINRWVR